MHKIVQSVSFAGVLFFVSHPLLATEVTQPEHAKPAKKVTQIKVTSFFDSSYGHVVNSFSLQAFTGVVHTPTADVVDYGNFEFY